MFKNRKLFKLVLGLGNNSLEQIEELCEIYSLAGANIFDLSPNASSIISAKNGVRRAGLNPDDFKYCISFGVKGDNHIKKAYTNDNCKGCGACVNQCPQDAIAIYKNKAKVETKKCIGCKQCACDSIDFFDFETDIKQAAKDVEKIGGVDMVELHISSFDKTQIFQTWDEILENFDCQKSICIDRAKYGNDELLELVYTLISKNPQKTIIQADGIPMSGNDAPVSTLQALAHAQLYQNLDAYIFISGGTNIYTGKMANDLNLRYNGITIGSYARNALKDLGRDDAILTAKKIVNSVTI